MTHEARSASEVLADHWRQGKRGTLDEDVIRNYSPDVTCFTRHGVFHGHDGVRHLNARLNADLPDGVFRYITQLAYGEVGFLEWSATSPTGIVRDGADSYVVHAGRIIAQTIHYTVESAS